VFSICGASACGQVLIPLFVFVWVLFGDVGAVSCFPLALVLCWCSTLSPVVFQVFVSCICNVALSGVTGVELALQFTALLLLYSASSTVAVRIKVGTHL
jgi:hypothetical protein